MQNSVILDALMKHFHKMQYSIMIALPMSYFFCDDIKVMFIDFS